MAHKPLKNYLACVAIDIGTTGTGYAYSSVDDFRSNHLDVTFNNRWTDEYQGLLALKTPTCLLLDPALKFHAFGYEAEDKYADLAAKELHNDWYYFERFKLQLYKSEVSNSNRHYSSKRTDTALFLSFFILHTLMIMLL